MKTAELRKKYLEFFQSKQSKYFSSDSLVPPNDPTLLFTSAGMNQFKDYFLGINKSISRATSCQKCLRTGDLERVGKTRYHHTFFEMLGNFSFGDYFKKEAIAWAWEFITKELNVPSDRLWVTVYTDDDEAFEIWNKTQGVPAERIRRYGASDNFWPQNALEDGPNGPCGPCSEIYFDYGAQYGCNKPDCGPACNCGRFVEVWNLVFTQYNRIGLNQTEPLPACNIDTGMGLERMAGVLQGKRSNYEIDILSPIVEKVRSIIKTDNTLHLNAITDHIRALTFCVADGVYPSNEDRGYVVRKILRRASWFAFVNGKKDPFLHTLVDLVVEMMKDQYPELVEKAASIKMVILSEEERFLKTLEHGKEVLFGYIEKAVAAKRTSLSGEEVFKLYDTYGFPFELTANIAAERELDIDEKAFKACMEQQKELSRANSKFADAVFVKGELSFDKKTAFVGYEHITVQTNVDTLVKDGTFVDAIMTGDCAALVLDQTPFYATKGGQATDRGRITTDGFEFVVTDVEDKNGTFLHKGTVVKGSLAKGANVTATIDTARRDAIARAHTATHLLQAALRTVVGTHVQQQGSFVEEDTVRFDFNHFQGLKSDELEKIEDAVNAHILDAYLVVKKETTQDEAKKMGALAFFEEKYGDTVRVVKIDGVSTEFCGGTHLDDTAHAGIFVITSESSVSSGIRRVEALTGIKARALLAAQKKALKSVCDALKVTAEEAVDAVSDLAKKAKQAAKELETAKFDQFVAVKAADIASKAQQLKTVKAAVFAVSESESGMLKRAIDAVRDKMKDKSVIVGFALGEKLALNVSKTKDLKGPDVHCGNIAETIAAAFGAQGGGKDDFGFCGMKADGSKDVKAVEAAIKDALAKAL